MQKIILNTFFWGTAVCYLGGIAYFSALAAGEFFHYYVPVGKDFISDKQVLVTITDYLNSIPVDYKHYYNAEGIKIYSDYEIRMKLIEAVNNKWFWRSGMLKIDMTYNEMNANKVILEYYTEKIYSLVQ